MRVGRESKAPSDCSSGGARVAGGVAFARANSPYYRELSKDLPAHLEDHTLLPVTDKKS